MTTKRSAFDAQGKPWAKAAEIKKGDEVQVDNYFDCMHGIKLVFSDDYGLYIKCSVGRHYLSGQLEEDYYVGIYKIEKESPK